MDLIAYRHVGKQNYRYFEFGVKKFKIFTEIYCLVNINPSNQLK